MKKLQKFDFSSAGDATYEWDKILDGGIYQLDPITEENPRGDFACKKTTMSTLIRNQAAKRGQSVQVGMHENSHSIVCQATSQPDEDRAEAWRARQAELRAARKAKGEAAEENGEVEE